MGYSAASRRLEMALYPLTVANTPRGEDLPEGGFAASKTEHALLSNKK
jgi:hypothetical protein